MTEAVLVESVLWSPPGSPWCNPKCTRPPMGNARLESEVQCLESEPSRPKICENSWASGGPKKK